MKTEGDIMNRFLPFCFLFLLSLPAAALDDTHAKYLGGTVPGITVGAVGRLDTTSETALTVVYAGNKIAIPYASIQSYEYSSPVARHLGILPVIVIGLIKARQHHHFFRISYRDRGRDQNRDPGNEITQVLVLEVSKHTPRVLEAILQARAPAASKSRYPSIPGGCGCAPD
jgi:hypothetical protein